MEKRLTRVENGKMLCGVCAGIGKYFNIDPTLVRLGFVILTCFGGSGLLAYLAAAIIIPKEGGYAVLSPPRKRGGEFLAHLR